MSKTILCFSEMEAIPCSDGILCSVTGHVRLGQYLVSQFNTFPYDSYSTRFNFISGFDTSLDYSVILRIFSRYLPDLQKY